MASPEIAQALVGPLLAILVPLAFRKGRQLYLAIWRALRGRITTVGDLAKVMAATRDEIIGRMQRQDEQIAAVKREFTTNGGSTVKDDIRAVRTELHSMRTEAHLREAVMRVRLEKPDVAGFEADPDGRLTIADETFQRLSGRPMRVLQGRGFLSVIAQEEQRDFIAGLDSAISEGREFRRSATITVPGSPTDTGGNQSKHVQTDWRIRPVFDEYQPSRPLVAFVGEVRRHASLPGTEVPASPARILNLPRAHTGD